MAAGEDHAEALVRDRVHVLLLVRRQLGEPGQQLRLARERLFAADAVDRAVARRGEDPGTGIRRCPVTGPARDRGRERLLQRVLGDVEIAEDARQDRERPSPLLAEDRLDYGCIASCGIGNTGRTSTAP